MKEQVPRLLERFDDPYGLTWRIANVFKRFSLRRAIRFAVGILRSVHYERPIFIVGMPRSGTTLLFYVLRQSSELGSLPHEGHDVWRMFHHPRYAGWHSDMVQQGQVRRGERRSVNAFFYSYFATQRFVEKTADNLLRIPYLLDLYPDSTFVVLKRNPCDVINSYINGWRHPMGRFRSYYVPEDLSIPDYAHRRRWCSTLFPGWRHYTSAPIPEIAFAQWKQYVESIEASRSLVPPSRWLEIYLEDLLDHPREVTEQLYAELGIRNQPRMEAKLAELLASPVNALTPLGKDKWRTQNFEEVRALLPRMAPLAQTLGYRLDPQTGVCTITRPGSKSRSVL